MGINISLNGLKKGFQEKISELTTEPEFFTNQEQKTYATDASGKPAVKLAVGNVPLDYDLWSGLRNPAVVGRYPLGLQEIWEFYAHRRNKKTDDNGRNKIFQLPVSFDFARENFSRAVIVSVMLPFAPEIIKRSAQLIGERTSGSSYAFTKMYEEVNGLIDKAVMRMGIDLMSGDNVVVAMHNKTVNSASAEAVPLTRQESSHGAAKRIHYPQKSVAVLMGLGQFGVSRIVFRDEIVGGNVQRFTGPLRSIIIFDQEELTTGKRDEIFFPNDSWREFLLRLFDFTQVDPEISQFRFCPYSSGKGRGCRKCIENCPSGAQENSTPLPTGNYSEKVLNRSRWFNNGRLQFDFNLCRDDRTRMKTLYPEWSCARCVSVCASMGHKRKSAVQKFSQKKRQLTGVMPQN